MINLPKYLAAVAEVFSDIGESLYDTSDPWGVFLLWVIICLSIALFVSLLFGG